MNRRVITTVLLLVSLLLPSPPHIGDVSPAGSALADQILLDGVTYKWWNAAWHMRLPVLLKPFIRDSLTNNLTASLEENQIENYPAEVEVDFTEAIRRAEGEVRWPQDPLKRLSSFTFDTDSVRVVWYSQESGEILKTRKGSDVIPATFAPALYENHERRTTIFDHGSNAIGTVSFILEGVFDAPRLFFIYFDMVENGKKSPPLFSEEELAPLESLYWISRGTEFYGYAPADGLDVGAPGPGTSLYVIAPHLNTTVRLLKFSGVPSGGTVPEPYFIPGIGPTAVIGGALTGAPTGILEIPIQRGDPYYFKFEATRPVLLAYGPVGLIAGTAKQFATHSLFYPSLDGGLVGKKFLVYNLADHGHSTDSIYCSEYPRGECVAATQIISFERAANVQATCLSCGAGSTPLTFTVPRESAVQQFSDAVGGAPFALGALTLVTSDAPIAIHGQGWQKDYVGYQGVSQYGSPRGRLIVGTSPVDFDVVGAAAGSVTAYEYLDPASVIKGTFGAGAPGHFYYYDDSHQNDARLYGFLSSGPKITVASGDKGLVTVGGEAGRSFDVVVQRLHKTDGSVIPTDKIRAFVFSVYNDTRITIHNYTINDVVANRTIGKNTVILAKSGSTVPLMPNGTYRISSSKPVFVYRLFEMEEKYKGFYPGRLEPPIYETGPAQFFGYLLSWTEDTRFITNTLKPGESAVFDFVIQNLARDVNGIGLADGIGLAASVDRAGWKVSLGAGVLENVSYLEKREVPVVLEVPANASTGDSAILTVTAQSAGNPNMKDRAQGLGTVQTKYEFEMKFVSNGKKEIQRVIAGGSSTSYAISIKNTGTGDDLLTFSTTRGEKLGFNATLKSSAGEELTDAFGKPAVTLPLAIGEEKTIYFNVTAPDTDQPIPFTATVQAVSENDASKVDQVSATTLINVESRIKVELDEQSLHVLPRESALFPVRIVNLGAATTVKMTFSGAFPAGWTGGLSETQFPLEGQGKVDPLGNRLDLKIVNFTLHAPQDVDVGKIVQSKVVATSQLETLNATLPSDFVIAEGVVANNFTHDVTAPPGKNLLPGETISYEMQIKSLANGAFTLDINPADLPPGWRYLGRTPADAQMMLPGETRLVETRFEMSRNVKPGVYNVSMGLTFSDERVATTEQTVLNFTAVVKRLEVLRVTEEEPGVLVAPGATRRVGLIVENTGNVEVDTTLGIRTPPGWESFFQDPIDGLVALEPGATMTVNVTVRAPEEFGERTPPFALTAPLSEGAREYPFNVSQIQYDLEIIDVTAPERLVPDEPVAFTLKVVNHGTAPATRVLIEMEVDAVPVRNATIESMPPGELRTVQLPWTVASGAKVARFVVDPDESYRETDEGNNAVETDLSRLYRTPGPQFLYLLLALAPTALLTRRR